MSMLGPDFTLSPPVWGSRRVAPTGSAAREVGDTSGVWEWRGHYWAHEDWDKEHLGALDSAYEQINENMDILEDYEDEKGVTMETDCVRAMLKGDDDWYGQTHIEPMNMDDLVEAHEAGEGGTFNFTYGSTIGMGSTTILLGKQYVRAIANTRKSEGCGEGDGDCSCMIADLATLIIHETAHVCLQTENGAEALGSYYQYRFKKDKGWDSPYCCGTNWGDWNAWNYSNAEADALGRNLGITRVTFSEQETEETGREGEWRVTEECGGSEG